MKKFTIHYLFIYFLSLNGFFGFAQNTIPQNPEQKIALKEKAENAYRNLKNKNVNLQNTSSVPKNQVFQLNETDPYQGRKSEFLNQIIPSELLSDFPIYNKSYGVKGYNQLITEYYKNHPTILKEALRYKLLPR